MTSRVSLSECYTIVGIIRASSLLLSQRQEFVLTSISHTLQLTSIIKSKPKTQKLCYALLGSNCRQVALTASKAIAFILGQIISEKLNFPYPQVESMYLWNSLQETLFPSSYLPYPSQYFWMASLVRWMIDSLISPILNQYDDVLMYPSPNQQARMTPCNLLIIIQCLISNFLFLQSKGFSMYFWTIQVFSLPLKCFSFFFKMLFSSQISSITVIPWPLFDSYPGFTIHIFFDAFLLDEAFYFASLLNSLVKISY